MFDDLQEVQLAGYLLAVEAGLAGAPREPEQLRPGFIGLKSLRQDHLKHEDFGKRAGEWPRSPRPWRPGCRIWGGAWRPGILSGPQPGAGGQEIGGLPVLSLGLLCGFTPAAAPEAEEVRGRIKSF